MVNYKCLPFLGHRYEDQLLLMDNTYHFSRSINKVDPAAYQKAIERVLNEKHKANGNGDKTVGFIRLQD